MSYFAKMVRSEFQSDWFLDNNLIISIDWLIYFQIY